jgi:hypothetical protein
MSAASGRPWCFFYRWWLVWWHLIDLRSVEDWKVLEEANCFRAVVRFVVFDFIGFS